MRKLQREHQCLSLREVQLAELNILLAFRDFCDENNLLYGLCGGSLLGAVRHRGFIPWDDDIDVHLLRADFNKIFNMAVVGERIDKYELHPYFYQTYGRDSMYIKMVDPTITVHEDGYRKNNNSNLWIDILPIDGVPSSHVDWSKECKRAQHLRRRVVYAHIQPTASDSKLKSLIKWPFVLFVQWTHIDKSAAHRLLLLATSDEFSDCSNVACVSVGIYGEGERFSKNDFLSPCEVEFEGFKFKAMSHWDRYLSNIYGDYMTLPPENKRHTHHFKAWKTTD